MDIKALKIDEQAEKTKPFDEREKPVSATRVYNHVESYMQGEEAFGKA